MRALLRDEYANVHRGVYYAEPARDRALRGGARQGAPLPQRRRDREIVFTRSATEAINLVAAELGRRFLQAGDEVVLSEMEHHANIVPWQLLRDATGHRAEGGADRRQRRARSSTTFAALLGRAPSWSRSPTCRTCSARSRRSKRDRAAGACAGVPVLLDGCQAVPHGRRRAGARLRFLRLLRPQALRADRHRRALRQGGAAGGDAALPGRRRHDPLRSPSRRRPTREPPHRSRRARPPSSRRSASARRSTMSTALGLDRDRGA